MLLDITEGLLLFIAISGGVNFYTSPKPITVVLRWAFNALRCLGMNYMHVDRDYKSVTSGLQSKINGVTYTPVFCFAIWYGSSLYFFQEFFSVVPFYVLALETFPQLEFVTSVNQLIDTTRAIRELIGKDITYTYFYPNVYWLVWLLIVEFAKCIGKTRFDPLGPLFSYFDLICIVTNSFGFFALLFILEYSKALEQHLDELELDFQHQQFSTDFMATQREELMNKILETLPLFDRLSDLFEVTVKYFILPMSSKLLHIIMTWTKFGIYQESIYEKDYASTIIWTCFVSVVWKMFVDIRSVSKKVKRAEMYNERQSETDRIIETFLLGKILKESERSFLNFVSKTSFLFNSLALAVFYIIVYQRWRILLTYEPFDMESTAILLRQRFNETFDI